MAFIPLNYDEGKVVLIPAKGSIAFVKGNALKDDGAGYITNGASGDNGDVRYVAAETITSNATDGVTLLNCWPVKGVRFLADTSADPAQTDVGTYCDLSAAGTVVAATGTDQVFFLEKIQGALTDRKVIGYFSEGVPNS